MEPAESPVTQITILGSIVGVEEKFLTLGAHKTESGEIEFQCQSLGWFILIDGLDWINVGGERPSLSVGDRVRINIQKDQA